MVYNNFQPPLRIVLNNDCNGRCNFCHQEGNKNQCNFSEEILNECIEAINKLKIVNVSLTGGEPTLFADLPHVINAVSDRCNTTKLSLTTNGKNLCPMIPQIKYTIHGVNLSIVSFDPFIASDYQNVVPEDALKGLEIFPAYNKTLNIMILNQNYIEFDRWVEFCVKKEYNLDLMFLNKFDSDYQQIQKYIMNKIIKMGEAQIILRSTPVMQVNISENNYIRIKHPFLSQLVKRDICRGCQWDESCFERVCAVRVYGDGIVSPCLSNYIQDMSENRVSEKIEVIYKKLENINGIYEFLL